MNYYDERFIKCPKCHTELLLFPRNNKYFKCYKCGNKIKDREYMLLLIKLKEKKWKKIR